MKKVILTMLLLSYPIAASADPPKVFDKDGREVMVNARGGIGIMGVLPDAMIDMAEPDSTRLMQTMLRSSRSDYVTLGAMLDDVSRHYAIAHGSPLPAVQRAIVAIARSKSRPSAVDYGAMLTLALDLATIRGTSWEQGAHMIEMAMDDPTYAAHYFDACGIRGFGAYNSYKINQMQLSGNRDDAFAQVLANLHAVADGAYSALHG